jgi:hypothetical protein
MEDTMINFVAFLFGILVTAAIGIMAVMIGILIDRVRKLEDRLKGKNHEY